MHPPSCPALAPAPAHTFPSPHPIPPLLPQVGRVEREQKQARSDARKKAITGALTKGVAGVAKGVVGVAGVATDVVTGVAGAAGGVVGGVVGGVTAMAGGVIGGVAGVGKDVAGKLGIPWGGQDGGEGGGRGEGEEGPRKEERRWQGRPVLPSHFATHPQRRRADTTRRRTPAPPGPRSPPHLLTLCPAPIQRRRADTTRRRTPVPPCPRSPPHFLILCHTPFRG